MFKSVPVQVWLLLFLAAMAIVPARYVWRYVVHSPSRRDIMVVGEDLDWRSSPQLALNLAMLGALVAVGIFIFTPWAAEFAHAPSFFPILMTGFATYVISTVVRGYLVGRIEPLSKGFHRSYERETQPRRFWASMAWNGALGCMFLWAGLQALIQAPADALTARCFDSASTHSAQDQLAACNQLLAKNPEGKKRAELVGSRGSAYYRAGDLQHAMGDYSEAISFDPGGFDYHFNRGLLDRDLRQPRWAIEDFDAAIAIRADYSGAYFNRGLVYLDLAKLDEALSDLTRAHDLAPTDPWPLANRGLAYAWKNDRTRAEKDFAAVRAIDPANIVVIRGQAVLGIKSGDLGEVVRQTTTALAHDAKDSWSLENRAIAYQRLGELDKAAADRARLQQLQKADKPH